MSLLSPPLAFLIYVSVVGLLLGVARLLAGASRSGRAASAIYASGEAAPVRRKVSPGYASFFGVALFFAVLHVGVLLASTGALFPIGAMYMAGLLAVLIVAVLE